MDKRYTENQEETSIYLRDLIFYLAKRWRSLLVMALIGALIGGILSAAASMRTPVAEEEEFVEEYVVDEALAEEMELAAQYRMRYNRQLQYMQNSILMQMDAGSYYQGVLILYITAGKDTGKVSVEFQSLAFEPSLYDDFAAALAYEGDTAYLSEVFQIYSKNFDDALAADSTLAVEEDQLTFNIETADEESCRTMLSVLEDYITRMDEELKEEYKDFSTEIILSEAYNEAGNGFLSRQAEQMSNLNTYYNRMTTLEADFTGNDLDYYEAAYLTDSGVEEDISGAEETEETEEAEGTVDSENSGSRSLHISVRWILLGVIGMIVLWGIIWVIKYILDESVKTSEEVKDTYHLPVLGRIDVGDTPKGIDGRLVSRYRKADPPADSISHVAAVINAMQGSGIALCGDGGDERIRSVMEELKQSSEQLECMEFIGKEDQALKEATELGREVLIVRTGRTTRAEVQRELELCDLQGIEILGVIVVE